MAWSEWLQARMDERGLVPYTLAKRAGVHASSIQRQLSGERGIEHELARAIAKGLDLPQTMVFRAAGLLTEADEDELDPQIMTGLRELQAMTPKQLSLAIEQMRAIRRYGSDAVPAGDHRQPVI